MDVKLESKLYPLFSDLLKGFTLEKNTPTGWICAVHCDLENIFPRSRSGYMTRRNEEVDHDRRQVQPHWSILTRWKRVFGRNCPGNRFGSEAGGINAEMKMPGDLPLVFIVCVAIASFSSRLRLSMICSRSKMRGLPRFEISKQHEGESSHIVHC